jgi:hypothetical protein
MKQCNDNLTWFQINNWIPLITTIVLVCGSFMLLRSDVSLLNEKVSVLLKGQETLIAKYEGVQKRLGACELSINTLETKMGIGAN